MQLPIDFCQGKLAHRYTQGIGKREPLARAVGVKANYQPHVIDATAGLGRDAFILACCGCQVTLLERNPNVAEQLAIALQRAEKIENRQDIIQRMQLVKQDAIEYLRQYHADVIYLDPMYPHRKKSALVKQEMRLLREIVGDDEDIEQLFKQAMQSAKKRVVVKRPKLAPPLAKHLAHHKIIGKTTRFDVYCLMT